MLFLESAPKDAYLARDRPVGCFCLERQHAAHELECACGAHDIAPLVVSWSYLKSSLQRRVSGCLAVEV